MRELVLSAVASLAIGLIGVSAWKLGSRGSMVIGDGEFPAAPIEETGTDPSPQQPAAAVVRKAVPPAPMEVVSAAGTVRDYGIEARLRPQLESYREANTLAEREDPLLGLALSDDPAVMDFLIDELHASIPASRSQVLDALIQYGDRRVIAELVEMAAQTGDPQERQALLETADYLALPSFTELRKGLWRPGEPAPTN